MKAKMIAAAIGALLVFVIAFLIAVTGVINVAADDPPPQWVEGVLHNAMERSVANRASKISVPELNDPALVASGAAHYNAMCVSCHGAPGVEPGEIAKGLNPRPPTLAEVSDPDPAAWFWVTKHGVMMTGMPAWGVTHDDESIWGMVALMTRFRNMSPDQYSALVAKTAGHGHGEHGHNHAH